MNSRNHFAKLLAASLLTMCSVSSVVVGAANRYTVDSTADTGDTTPGNGFCGTEVAGTPGTPAGPMGVPPAIPPGDPVQSAGTCTLRAAIQEANGNAGVDTIDFNIAGTGMNATTVSITLTSDLPPVTEPVIIDATTNEDAVTIDGGGQFALLNYSAAATSSGNSEIRTLTLTGGLNDTALGGGAIYFGATFPSKLTLTNVTLNANTTVPGQAPGAGPGGPGGAIAVSDGNALVVNGGSITGNSALVGGGIHITSNANGPTGVANDLQNLDSVGNTNDDLLTLNGVNMAGNSATAGNGGAVYADLQNGGDILVEGGIFGSGTAAATRNTATGDGGAFWVSKRLTSSDVRLRDAMVTNNAAANGAGVAVKLGRILLRNVTLNANVASAAGGALYLDANVANVSGGSAFIENTTFSGNTAATQGGAIAAAAGNPAHSAMIHATLADNLAAANGGAGISVAMPPNLTFPGDVNNPFTSNLFSNADDGRNCRVAFAHADSNNSGFQLASDTSCGFTQASDRQGVAAAQIALSPLAVNAADASKVQTRKISAASVAIDAGNPVWSNTRDARGADRQDGDTNDSVLRDIGAHEFGGFGLIELAFTPNTSRNQDASENVTPAVVLVKRSGTGTAATAASSVNFSAAAGTATATDDFTAITNQAVPFAANVATPNTQMVNVTLVNDGSEEPDETINLSIASNANTGFADVGIQATGTLTIKDRENGRFQFDATTYSGIEGNTGSGGSVTLMVTRTGGSLGAVEIPCTTEPDTAMNAMQAGSNDYNPACVPATINFADGDVVAKPVTINFTGDNGNETNETFRVRLGAPSCGAGCDASTSFTGAMNPATVTITDDDGAPAINITDVMQSEEMGTFTFKISLTPASLQTVTVRADTANDTAMAGSDYTARSNQTITFAPGMTEADFVVTVTDDTQFEADETFFVNLSNVTGGAEIADPQGLGTILNADTAPANGSFEFDVTSASALEGADITKTINVTRRGGAQGRVFVDYTVTNGTGVTSGAPGACTTAAQLANEYNGPASGRLTFNNTDAANKPLTFTVCNDTRVESNQKVSLQITAVTCEDTTQPCSATIGTQADSVLTLVSDEEPRYQLTQTEFTVREGNDLFASFTVEALDAVDGEAVCIPYETMDGPMGVNGAVSPGDYAGVDRSDASMATMATDDDACGGALSFANGQGGSKSFSVMVVDDGAVPIEQNETFTANLFKPVGGVVLSGADVATVTIANQPRIFFSRRNYASANESGTVQFVLTREGELGGSSSVQYRIDTGTGEGMAGFGTDINTSNGQQTGTVNFAAGSNSATISVEVLSDAEIEGDETFTVTLTNANNASLPADSDAMPRTATGTVTDDDFRFEFAAATSAFDENVMGGQAAITVKRIGRSLAAATVDFAIAEGTATTADYGTPASMTVRFEAGRDGEQTINIPLTNDTLDEVDESFTVTLTNPSTPGVLGAQTSHTVTLTDNDLPPVLSIESVEMNEGNMGEQTYAFTAMLDAPSAKAVMVTATTADGTAVADSDYTSNTAMLMIPAGQTIATFEVVVRGDTLFEADEAFTVTLSNPSNATFADDAMMISAEGKILNDDIAPTISIGDATVIEGNDGSSTLVFPLTLSEISGQDVTVRFDTSDGSATAGADYTAVAAGSATIPANSGTEGSLSITVSSDLVDEMDETLTVTLSEPMAATLGTADAIGTLIDDDTATVSIAAAPVVVEGENVVFPVMLSAVSDRAITVGFSLAPNTASEGSDYTVPATSEIVIAAGDMSGSITVASVDDAFDEADIENFTATLTSADHARIAASPDHTAAAALSDNDNAASVSISLAPESFSEAGGTATLTATLTGGLSETEVQLGLTYNGTAQRGSDYAAASSIVIPAGQRNASITLMGLDDAVFEAEESLTAVISSTSTNVTTGSPSQVNARLIDNDPVPTVSVADTARIEGNSGSAAMVFTVTLSQAAGARTTVSFATANGSATAGVDYTAASGTLTFEPGETSKPVLVPVTGDTVNEINETFMLVLSAPVNTQISDGTAVGTITNDDTAPTLSVADTSVAEGSDQAVTLMRFTVSLSGIASEAVTVRYDTSDGSAAAGEDYTASSGTVSIAAGQTSASFTVPVTADSRDESDETFTATLSNGSVGISRAQALATITDDDTAPASASAADGQGRTLGFSTSAGGFEGLGGTAQPGNAPGNLVYDNGFFAYTIAGLARGGSATVTVTFPVGSSATTYVNCPSECISSGSGAGQTVTLTLVDGGPGDADGVVNGRIMVRAGAGGRAPAANVPGTGGGGGGDNDGGGGGGGGSLGVMSLFGLVTLLGLRRRRLG